VLRGVVDLQSRFGGQVFSGDRPLVPGQIAYVPQSPAGTLSPWADVAAEIALCLRARELNGSEWRRRVERLMDELGLWIPLGRRVEWLSGGQRVKVALLRALAVPDPRLLVMDEPFEGLDLESRNAVTQVVRAEVSRGVPVIVTSHRAEDLQALGAKLFRFQGAPISELVEVPSGQLQPPAAGDGARPALGKEDSLSVAKSEERRDGLQRATAFLFGGVGFVVGVLCWSILASLVGNKGLLPGPLSVLREMGQLVVSADLAPHFGATMGRAAFGWIAANVVAVPLGILLGYNTRFFQTAAPWLSICRSLPIFVLVAPAAGLFPKLPEGQRESLLWLALFVISIQAVSAAAALAPRRRVDIARIFGASHWFCLTRIMPFEAVTGIFAAMEVTLPLSVVICLVLETFLIPKTGLGLYVFNHLNDADLSLLFAHILWPGVIVAVLLALIRRLSRAFRYEL